ncbi:hypothetical protein EB74_08660 [Mycobacterium sp. SWH-M5]|nr:hypothetical protein EB74_08660 [Mycobacterium sp. SWH-M5]
MVDFFDTEQFHQWFSCSTPPVMAIKHRAKVSDRDGRKWITYHDTIKGEPVVVEMPSDAPTKSCDEGRHDDCPHRIGQRAEGGVMIKLTGTPFVWRCGCPCHYDPMRIGRLF